MTAINPAKLKIQCAGLSEYYAEPARFVSGLHDLLAFYSARIRQTSLSRTPLTLQTYQVPAPVLRALKIELEEYLNSDPNQGLKLVENLWQEEWVEFRQLSIILLGNLPTTKPEALLDHIQYWIKSCTAEDIRNLIMTQGLGRLREEKLKQVLDFFKDLIQNGKKSNTQAALFGLLPVVENPAFDNLPVIYNLLAEILLVEETGLVKEITTLLSSLQDRSEQETTYFLVRQLSAAAKPRIFRVVRQVIPKFRAENQAVLKDALRNYS